jgi:hypothetical protein
MFPARDDDSTFRQTDTSDHVTNDTSPLRNATSSRLDRDPAQEGDVKRSIVVSAAMLCVACSEAPLTGTRDLVIRKDAALAASAPIEAVLPSGYTSIMGETNNSFPHSVRNLRYQQVFSGSDVVNPLIVGLCLRRDDTFGSAQGTQILTIKLGPTSLDYTSLTTSFSGNYSAPPTEVFSGEVVIPAAAAGGTPADFDLCIPFTQSYEHPAGSNLIVEVLNTSLVSANLPRDACDGTSSTCTTTRAFAFSPTAENAALVMRGGLIMKLISPAPPAPLEPVSHDECTKGRWADFQFRNQGQCVRFVETGEDSRLEQ